MKIRRIIRYTNIYGVSRTFAKVMGRIRPLVPLWLFLKFPWYKFDGLRVGIFGAGQHAYSSIAFYLCAFTKSSISFVFDINRHAAFTLAKAYRSKDVGTEIFEELNNGLGIDLVYVASNHATHVDYAVNAMSSGIDVFIEKPIVVDASQWQKFLTAANLFSGNIYVGYNRPFAKATRVLSQLAKKESGPFTLSFFVTAHFIDAQHWYRKASEGSRVVANMSHWLDMSIHTLFWKNEIPEYIDISISYSNAEEPSDNVSLSIVSSAGDLINIVFTSRSEPYEGVYESVNFNRGDLISKIDDFRSMTIWSGDKKINKNFRPKDNGHKACILQPFDNSHARNLREVFLSTELMLHVEKMVTLLERNSRFFLSTSERL